MLSRHGSLECAILSALWGLEQNDVYTNSVKDVYEILANKGCEKRAYTTIKTVMDRLHDKRILLRYKDGKKFFYRTVYSKNEIIIKSLTEIANRYCDGNLNQLSVSLNEMMEDNLLVSV
ncbi:MAG: BlaI/MecI/CopY family transcriptional regulator [Candidatus Gastranaerophilales bacterium]|nr:BlaI/MecI/CopY family transcriptional regulator [Candidatus Gastranaerophilales bacterium]